MTTAITVDQVPETMNVPPAGQPMFAGLRVRTTDPADQPGSATTQLVCIVLTYQGTEPRTGVRPQADRQPTAAWTELRIGTQPQADRQSTAV